MKDFNSSPASVSHKQLNKLLASAPKDISLEQNDINMNLKEIEDFNDLLNEWREGSQSILSKIKRKDSNLFKNRNQKSLMSLGALESYLTLAFQASDCAKLD